MSPNPYHKDTSIINNDETMYKGDGIEMSDFSMASLDEPCDPMIQEREQEILNRSRLQDDYSMEIM